MSVINLSLESVGYEAINLKSVRDIPLFTTIREYYKGTGAEYANFLTSNGMSYEKNFNSIHYMHEHISNSVKILKGTFENGITDKFDFKAVSVLNSKMFDNFSEDDYSLLRFDISKYSDEQKEKIKGAFFNSKCKSFVYFKEADNDELRLFYHRKGITLDENNALKIYTSKNKVSITEGYKSTKDANFIASGFILEMSKIMKTLGFENDTFSYTYERADGLTNTIEFSILQIIQIANTPKEEKELIEDKEIIRQEINQELDNHEGSTAINDAKEIAKAQIKQERSQKRQSLRPENIEEQILKSSYSQVRFSKDVLEKEDVDLEKELDKVLDDYDNKEIEKRRILLQEARQKAKYAFADLEENIKNGIPISEGLEYVTQTYRNPDVTKIASAMLTEKLLRMALQDKKIENLNETITAYSVENDKLLDVIAKREKTIKELQSTLTKKSNEINLVLEATEEKMKQISLETEKKLYAIEKKYENEIGELSELVDKQEAIIGRLKFEKENTENSYKKSLEEKDNDVKRLENEIGQLKEFKYKSNSLEKQVEEKDAKISKLEIELDELKSIKYENNILQKNASEKDAKISKLENEVDVLKEFKYKCNTLEEQNKSLQDKIRELEERLKRADNSSVSSKSSENNDNSAIKSKYEKKNKIGNLFDEIQELEQIEKKFQDKNLVMKNN